MGKNLVFLFDGTGYRSSGQKSNSNVLKIATAISPINRQGDPQIVFYHRGVGAGSGIFLSSRLLDSLFGGVFGTGMESVLLDAYRQISLNFAPGDRIFLFGWSRGAYTAIRFADILNTNLIQNPSGIADFPELIRREIQEDRWKALANEIKPDHIIQNSLACQSSIEEFRYQQITQKPKRDTFCISYMGLFDCVPAIGGPLSKISLIAPNKHLLRDIPSLSEDSDVIARISGDRPVPNNVRSIWHAVALDERSIHFQPYLFSNMCFSDDVAKITTKLGTGYSQVGFPGGHSSVGGTFPDGDIGNLTLQWIATGAAENGLSFDKEALGFEINWFKWPRPQVAMEEAERDSGMLFRWPSRARKFNYSELAVSDAAKSLMERHAQYAARHHEHKNQAPS